MSTLLNPYIAGAPVVERSMFFGRLDIFDWIERSLTGRYVNHLLVIHGQRRVGKTSVLKQIPNFISKHYLQVFFDLQGRTNTTLDRFLWWLAREIARTLRQECDLSVAIPDREVFAQDGETLSNRFLPEVRSLLGERELLLTFDEFDTLDQPEVRQTLAQPLVNTLRGLFEQDGLNFIFSIGSSGHKLENMQASYTDFFKTALYKKISFLSQPDCVQLVTQPVSGVLEYHPQAVERIYAVTAGHPYFTQLVCHELFSLCQKTGRRLINLVDVDGVLDDVIERGTVNLKFVWDEATALEKWILACLAPAGAGLNERELGAKIHQQRVRFSEPDMNAALLHLRDKDVLTADNRFIIHLMRLWLQRNRPLERVREELVEVNPIANRYVEIGEEYHALGQLEKALESFRQALVVDPANLKAQVSTAAIHLEEKSFSQAVEAYEKALTIDDEDVAARTGFCESNLALGDQASSVNDLDQAVRFYRRVLEVNADHTEARQHLADVYVSRADTALAVEGYDDALVAMQEALLYTPEDETLQARFISIQQHKLEKTLLALLATSERQAAAQNWESALAALQEAQALAPEDPRIQTRREAISASQRAAHLQALHTQTRSFTNARRWDEALAAWEQYLSLEPQDAQAAQEAILQVKEQRELAQAYSQAQAALEKKDYATAVRLLKKVVLQDENYVDAARLLAQAIAAQRKQPVRLPKWVREFKWPRLSKWVYVGAAILTLAGLLVVVNHFVPFAALFNSITTRGGTPPVSSAQPYWSQDYTKYALADIASREPDFSDDFSSQKPEWNDFSGGKIDDGALILSGPEAWAGGEHLNASNFVIQYDFWFGSPPPYGRIFTGVKFHQYSDEFGLVFNINLGDSYYYLGFLGNQRYGGGLDNFDASQTHQLKMIVLGDQVAINLDDTRVASYTQPWLPRGKNMLYASYGKEFYLEIDNLKFWKLAEPELPVYAFDSAAEKNFTDTYLGAVQDRPPDFQDDFFTQKVDWITTETVNFATDYRQLVLSAEPQKIAMISGKHLAAQDFVLEYSFGADLSMGAGHTLHTCFGGVAPDLCANEIVFDLSPPQTILVILDNHNQFYRLSSTPFKEGNRLQLVVIGGELAVLLNDVTIGYFTGQNLSEDKNIAIYTTVLQGHGKTGIGDLKFWNLDAPAEATPPPTLSASPPSTATAAPEPGFTQSVMQSIASRPPDFEDDFSTRKEEWYASANVDFIPSQPAAVMLPEKDRSAVLQARQIYAKDFVLEYSYASEETNGALITCFRGNLVNDCGYQVKIDLRSEYSGAFVFGEGKYVSLDGISKLYSASENRLRLIVQGNQIAIFLNDKQVGIFMDDSYQGYINFIQVSVESGQPEVAIRDLKFWNLESTPPSSEPQGADWQPVLADINSRPPDFEDDFSTPKVDLTASEGVQLHQGTLIFHNQASDFAIANIPQIQAQDYALQFDITGSDLTISHNRLFRIEIRQSISGNYAFSIDLKTGCWEASKEGIDLPSPTTLRFGCLELSSGPLLTLAQGDRFAFYLNNSLIVSFQDYAFATGATNLSVGSKDRSSAKSNKVHLDNLKFWLLNTSVPSSTATPSASVPSTRKEILVENADQVQFLGLITLEGKQNRVLSLDFSPNGKQLASGSDDFMVRLWQVVDFTLQRTLVGHTGSVWSVDYSPDGSLLASGGAPSAYLWQISDGTVRNTLEKDQFGYSFVRFSPDGNLLAVNTRDNMVQLLKLTDLNPTLTLTGDGNLISDIEFSPDSKYLAAIEFGNIARLWQVSDGSQVWIFANATADLEFSPSGDYIAVISPDNSVNLWNFPQVSLLRSLESPGCVSSIAIAPGSKVLATGLCDGNLVLWKVDNGTQITSFSAHAGEVYALAFSPDGSLLASGGEDGIIRFWGVP